MLEGTTGRASQEAGCRVHQRRKNSVLSPRGLSLVFRAFRLVADPIRLPPLTHAASWKQTLDVSSTISVAACIYFFKKGFFFFFFCKRESRYPCPTCRIVCCQGTNIPNAEAQRGSRAPSCPVGPANSVAGRESRPMAVSQPSEGQLAVRAQPALCRSTAHRTAATWGASHGGRPGCPHFAHRLQI